MRTIPLPMLRAAAAAAAAAAAPLVPAAAAAAAAAAPSWPTFSNLVKQLIPPQVNPICCADL